MRFVFSPPTEEAAGLLSLPWTHPLEEWQDPRLVEIRQRGISRHIVRFVADDGELYALKAINENLARREYRLLRELAELNVPAGRPTDGPAARRAGRAPGAAAPVRLFLGRLLAVQHVVPLRRGHARGLPGRRGDQRAPSLTDRRPAALRRGTRRGTGLRRAPRPSGR